MQNISKCIFINRSAVGPTERHKMSTSYHAVVDRGLFMVTEVSLSNRSVSLTTEVCLNKWTTGPAVAEITDLNNRLSRSVICAEGFVHSNR